MRPIVTENSPKQNTHRQILVTNALPYANGDLHLGHILGYVQADVWVRFQRMLGNTCWYVCGDDAHGTPIMLKAEQMGISPESMVADYQTQHHSDFTDFEVNFDYFYTTHSEENKQLSQSIYQKLDANGFITSKTISQAYDPEKQMFLPDRFVKGECPKCHAPDQYGDNCEVCGATYNAMDLINPYSVVSGVKPTTKETDHFFFDLPKCQPLLEQYLEQDHLQEETKHKLQEWLETGLKPWDITRDAPYFGFNIPGYEDKYFYVWLDAPMGYMASSKKLAETTDFDFDYYWCKQDENNPTELIHFIGKDIIYFHALFWPAVLDSSGYRTPSAVYANGFLTVNGQKMSKSRGTFIKARTYLNHLDASYLRYYFSAKLNAGIDDLDLNLEDFKQRVNSDLVGKLINIASRCSGFINKHYDQTTSDALPEQDLFEQLTEASLSIQHHYETREFSKAVRDTMLLADITNQYIDKQKPWKKIKDDELKSEVQGICTQALCMFKVLMTYLKPILPKMAKDVEEFLNIEPLNFANVHEPLLNHQINKFKPLLSRIDDKSIEAIIEASKTSS